MVTRLAHVRSGSLALVVLASALVSPQPAAAQQIKGPTTCFKCHKPQARSMWETDAPFHKKSVEQLSAPKAAAFATAIGLASPTTVTGRPGDCVSCHATIVGGTPSVGVSCESCHGPASGYFTGHQEPEFFDQPQAKWMGLHNMFNDPRAIAETCVNCHVTPDPRLKKAGHPAGENFDAGKGMAKMVHWPSDISVKRKRSGYGPALYAQVSAQGGPLVAKRLASGGAPAAAAAAPAAPPKAGGPPPVAAPGAAPAAAAAAGGAPPPPAPRPRPAAKAADPFDWDQPVAALPADYPGEGGAPPAPQGGPAAAAPVAPAAAPPAAPRAPSTAAELPPAPEAPALSKPATVAPAGPAPVTAPVPAVRGRAALVMAQLLKSKGAAKIVLPPPSAPREFDGPDGELLRLQDEILYLALESLRKGEP
jgi:hypothetical protein